MFSSLHEALEAVTLALDLMPAGGAPSSTNPSSTTPTSSSPGPSTSPVHKSKHLVTRARASFERCYRCAHIGTGDSAGGSSGGGSFEWVDGVVVTALKTGAWLLVDNVNLCSPRLTQPSNYYPLHLPILSPSHPNSPTLSLSLSPIYLLSHPHPPSLTLFLTHLTPSHPHPPSHPSPYSLTFTHPPSPTLSLSHSPIPQCAGSPQLAP